jgi:hypothetical protein
MPEADFATALLETEVVVTHIGDGHVFHFPILSNGIVSLHGARMEPNPDAKREARRYLFDAHNAARAAVGRSFVWRGFNRASPSKMAHRGASAGGACAGRDWPKRLKPATSGLTSGLPRLVQGLSWPVVVGDLGRDVADHVRQTAYDQGDRVEGKRQRVTQVVASLSGVICHVEGSVMGTAPALQSAGRMPLSQIDSWSGFSTKIPVTAPHMLLEPKLWEANGSYVSDCAVNWFW